jgi:hypothetical protein
VLEFRIHRCTGDPVDRGGVSFPVDGQEFAMSLDKQENISNGPTENLNLKIKSSKRITRGYRSFVYYQP